MTSLSLTKKSPQLSNKTKEAMSRIRTVRREGDAKQEESRFLHLRNLKNFVDIFFAMSNKWYSNFFHKEGPSHEVCWQAGAGTFNWVGCLGGALQRSIICP